MDINTIFSVLIGGGILGFIEFLIKRRDAKHDKQAEVLEAIRKLQEEVSEVKMESLRQNAILARTHILRFSDELYNGVHHSKEYFEQTLDDINTYNMFCEKHDKTFQNGRTVMASEYIQSEYKRLVKEHKL